jgi:uncharacterized protein YoxC
VRIIKLNQNTRKVNGKATNPLGQPYKQLVRVIKINYIEMKYNEKKKKKKKRPPTPRGSPVSTWCVL